MLFLCLPSVKDGRHITWHPQVTYEMDHSSPVFFQQMSPYDWGIPHNYFMEVGTSKMCQSYPSIKWFALIAHFVQLVRTTGMEANFFKSNQSDISPNILQFVSNNSPNLTTGIEVVGYFMSPLKISICPTFTRRASASFHPRDIYLTCVVSALLPLHMENSTTRSCFW